ncbi:hypothetical protein GmHk_16G046176 [Glycine max]|nr:hypothetical protein GmHk_16G046176 [Glycine max]
MAYFSSWHYNISENYCQLKKHVAIEEESVSQNRNSSILKNEHYFSSCAIIALKETVVAVEPISTKTARDAQETKYKERSELGGKLEENNFHYHDSHSDIDDLWYATTRGLRSSVEDSVLSKEKHHERMVNFCLDDIDSGEAISSTKVQCSISSLILLLKNDMKELIIGWSVILPLSWIKAFWILLISNGAYAIDCKAYTCFMEAKATAFIQNAELHPPSIRHLRVPILPPWVQWETPDLSTWEHLTNAISLPNPCHGNFEISNSNSGSNSLDGIVVRTGCMLTTFLNKTKTGQLLLFPYEADGKARMSKFINSELKLDQRHRKSDIYDHKLCFVRVHLHPFKEGCFEEGAVICMDFKCSYEKREEGI